MKKRSVTLKGHATSITLEDEFWRILKSIAKNRDVSLAELINEIDEHHLQTNPESGLSSAIRVYILKHLNAQIDQLTRE
jgi:predicted DNA-binding ribbon-helix-helix protein